MRYGAQQGYDNRTVRSGQDGVHILSCHDVVRFECLGSVAHLTSQLQPLTPTRHDGSYGAMDGFGPVPQVWQSRPTAQVSRPSPCQYYTGSIIFRTP